MLAPQGSPLSVGGGPNTGGVSVQKGVARGMGKIQGACLGLWEEKSWKKTKEAENTSLVIATPAVGAGRGRSLYLSG